MTEPNANEKMPDAQPAGISRGNLVPRVGIGLILLSGVFWFSMLAVPFLPLSAAKKVALAGALFAGVQIAWWTGAALAGPKTVQIIKSWFRRKK